MNISTISPKARANIIDGLGKLPLTFELNQGQIEPRVKFVSRTSSYSLFLTADEAVIMLRAKAERASKSGLTAESLPSFSGSSRGAAFAKTVAAAQPTSANVSGGVLRMKLRNANPAAKVSGEDEAPGTSNYFIGNDPAKWRTKVPKYAKVKYEGIYSGIDLVYYGSQGQLEYDFVVAPGANPRQIAFDIRGASRVRQTAQGDLVLNTGGAETRWRKPFVYQEKDGTREQIAARYIVSKADRISFAVAKYDSGRPLYIDPLLYSTFLGGTQLDSGYGIAVDNEGNAYVVGNTCSADFPTVDALQATYGGGSNPPFCGDAFVAKINSSGSALVYSTYLGGSDVDLGLGIAVDKAGNAFVTGETFSSDFPTMNPVQASYGGGGDAFVVKLNPSGSALIYATYLGGSGNEDSVFGWSGNAAGGIAVDRAGNAYVTGTTASSDFPVTPGAFQTSCSYCVAAFVAKLSPTGSLTYATYLGGNNRTLGYSIAADRNGNAYITGGTRATDFPITEGAFQTANRSADGNAFVTKLNPSGSALVYSTYLGGSGGPKLAYFEASYGVALDSTNNAYVTGVTFSIDFPITAGAFQTVCNRGHACDKAGDAFVSKLNATGSALIYSTYLGGTGQEWGGGIAVDSTGNAYVAGSTNSTNFPTVSSLQPLNGGQEVFVTKINAAGAALVYSTYLGGEASNYGTGIALDGTGSAYVTGYTSSNNFPTQGPLQAGYGGGQYDAFASKISIAAITTTTLSSSPNPSIYGQNVALIAKVSSSLGVPPDGETITFMKGKSLLGTGKLSAGSATLELSSLAVGTNLIVAMYSGDSDFGASQSNLIKQVVEKEPTTTALASSPNPSATGQAVTFTATVTPEFTATVKGTVTFYDGSTKLKAVTLKAQTMPN